MKFEVSVNIVDGKLVASIKDVCNDHEYNEWTYASIDVEDISEWIELQMMSLVADSLEDDFDLSLLDDED